MKNLLKLLVLISTLSTISFSQDNQCLYLPMSMNQSWSYVCDDFTDTLTSKIIDTLSIADKKYYEFAPYGYDSPNWPTYWLRPESRKIFCMNLQDSLEYLLFNFDAQINSTWEIPSVIAPPFNVPVNQCDWGQSVKLISNSEKIINNDRTFYNCILFSHLNHPCADAGISNTLFAKNYGMVGFSQITIAGVRDWKLIVDKPDTSKIIGIYTMIGNPCLTVPCLPGIVCAVRSNDTNYVLTKQDIWFRESFSWNGYTPFLGDSVEAKGIIRKCKDINGNDYFRFEVVDFEKFVATSVNENNENVFIKKDYLFQNYPNPFNPETTIEYYLSKQSSVKITVFDLMGNEIEKIIDEYQRIGKHNVLIDATKLSSGYYYYQLRTENDVITKPMLLIK